MVFRIGFSTQLIRYESKNIQAPADVLQRMASIFGVSINYIISGSTSNEVEQTLKDAELINRFIKIDKQPEDEKCIYLKVITWIRDFNPRQVYVL